MTVGKKIKFVRTFRKMTQKELGIAIGLTEQGADNRIAQYETDYRVPKRDMLINMANALNVNPLAFIPEYYGPSDELLNTYFWLEEENPSIFHFLPMIKSEKKYNEGHNISAIYDDNDDMPVVPPIGIWMDYDALNRSLQCWLEQYTALENEEITRDEYLDWKLRWPDSGSEI